MVAEARGGGRIDWLASYPKSGNTWLRVLLANYFGEDDEPQDINSLGVTRGIASARWLFDSIFGIASSDLHPAEIEALRPELYRILAQRSEVRFWLKVHDSCGTTAGGGCLFPPEATGVAVYIVRNPLDVAVSNAFHDGHRDMARAVEKMCDATMTVAGGNAPQLPQRLGDWSAHVTSWVDRPDIPVLVVRYEDMLADAAAVLERVLGFARPELAIDPRQVARAVHHSRIEALQAAEDATGFRETAPGATRFFRNGRADDWRHHLSPAQVARIRDHHLVVMQRFGYA